MKKSCLVLQGGGMRGMYTSGVLDAFMDNGVYINNIYAVSAGCYNALSYLSRQKGRTFRVNTTYLNDKRYINMAKVLTNGNVFNVDFIFNEVNNELDPFDYDAFEKYCDEFYAVSTDCETGEAVYARVRDLKEDADYVKASAALPLFTKLVKVDGKILTDGGVADGIPLRRAIEDGFTNNVVILTRPKGYVLGPTKFAKLYKWKYKKYPKLIETMEKRIELYDKSMELVDRLEEAGKIIVIRPEENLNISHLEKDIDKIRDIYNLGYRDGIKYIDKVKKFTSEPKKSR